MHLTHARWRLSALTSVPLCSRIGISPDTFEPWPHSLPSMVRWALEPVDEATTLFLIERGRRDSSAWIETMGLREEESAGGGQVPAAKEAAASHERGAGVTGGADVK